jgi:mannose-6-phosphate isomerase-like protein (cupin superfamily)
MKLPVIKLTDKIKEIKAPWTPVEVVRYNDQVIRVALFKDEYHWHKHEVDELFHVLKGSIIIQMKGTPNVLLSEGEYCVVPKRVEHCPKSFEESIVLMIEPHTLKSEGD